MMLSAAPKKRPPRKISASPTAFENYEDQNLHRWETSGALQQVVGSQSLLSQELLALSSQEDNDEILQFSQSTTQQSGLLTQDDDDDDKLAGLDAMKQAACSVPVALTPSQQGGHPVVASKPTSSYVPPAACKMAAVAALEDAQKENLSQQQESQSQESTTTHFDSLLDVVALVKQSETTPLIIKSRRRHLRLEEPSPVTKTPRRLQTPPTSKVSSWQQQQRTPDQALAIRAADLAERVLTEPDLAKRLLLSMAVQREAVHRHTKTIPDRPHAIPDGFYWAHYPPLEGILRDNMECYYQLSLQKSRSIQQQVFHQELMDSVRHEANQQGWRIALNDKQLRDRIRCYYKTHLQNAKKRLRTMLSNPTKKANAKQLTLHLDLIQQAIQS